MNGCIHRRRHKHSPYQRVHIEIEHAVSWLATNFLPQVRVDFPKSARPLRRISQNCLANLCQWLSESFLWQQVFGSLHLSSNLHLIATFENSMQRPHLSLSQQVSLHSQQDPNDLCETEVCILHIQLVGTNVWLPKIHNIPPEVDFEPARPPAKSESWNSASLHCCAVFATWQSLFTDQRMSGLPMRARYGHFRTISEQTLTILLLPQVFFLELMVIKAWRGDFVQLLSCFICQFATPFRTFLRMTFHVIRPRDSIRVRFLPTTQCISCSSRNWWFEHVLVVFNSIFACIKNHVDYIPSKRGQEMVLVLLIRRASSIHFTSDRCFASFQPILGRPRTQTRKILFCRFTNRHAQFGTFSHPCSNRIFSKCLSHTRPASGWPYRFRWRGTTESSLLDQDLCHLCRGRRIQMSGHSDFGMFNGAGASSILSVV